MNGDEIQAVAQVKARHRAPGALERMAVLGAREADHRVVQAVLKARGEDADDPFVPARNEEAAPVFNINFFQF